MTWQVHQESAHIAAHLDQPLVVGVAPDGRSASAVIWAAEEANRTGHPLCLVTADDQPQDGVGTHDLASVARRLTLADVRHVVRDGRPSRVLLEESESAAALTVIGRRGMSRLRRSVVGGTSLTVVTRSPIVVIVVPEEWIQPDLCSAPIVLGLAPQELFAEERVGREDPQRPVIEFAFDRAQSMRVPLRVTSAWGIPPSLLRDPSEVADCRDRFADQLDRRLAPWRAVYPGVPVSLSSAAVNAVDALLDAERAGQLTVVGRHRDITPPPSLLGSTAGALIRRAHRPVAVVPINQA